MCASLFMRPLRSTMSGENGVQNACVTGIGIDVDCLPCLVGELSSRWLLGWLGLYCVELAGLIYIGSRQLDLAGPDKTNIETSTPTGLVAQ